MANEKVTNAVQVILNELNNISTSARNEVADTILETVSRDHRTLQESFWDAILKAQMRYADSPHDPRNEYAVKLAKVVKQAAIDNNLDYGLPCI